VILLRTYPILADSGAVPLVGWMAPDRQLGRRTFAEREAYAWAASRTPPTAILQHNPEVNFQDTAAGLYADRQSAAWDLSCTVTFGGDPGECAPVVAVLRQLYSAAPPPGSFEHVCSTLPVDILLVKDIDPAWRSRASWVWNRRPLFANEYVRLFGCRAP
jgi:hypothetical protein